MGTSSVVLRVLLFTVVLAGIAAAQSGNATVSATVTVATSALIHGVTIKEPNT